jgi:hypothetical protein
MSLASLILAVATVATPPPACAAAEHRQFDFWLGEWDVVGVPDAPNAGQLLGRNRIESISSGCALSEHWRGASGFEGHSLNGYDAAHRVWRQFWIGSDGVVLQLAGGWRDGRMVLDGELPGANGARQRQRISWIPQTDGGVIQRWETSDDDGTTWAVAFLGLYRRAAR